MGVELPVKGALAIVVSLFCSTPVLATPDEVKVLTNKLVEPGELEGTLYTNYALHGRNTARYEGEVVPHHAWRITPELSYGLGEHWDTGLFLPISYSKDHNSHLDGARARIKYIAHPEQVDKLEFIGADAELWYADKVVSEFGWRVELKGIVGLHRPAWLISLNPILRWNLTSAAAPEKEGEPPERRSIPELGYAFKSAYKLESHLAVGLEHYAEVGNIDHIHSWSKSDEVSYAVVDFVHQSWDFNVGVGHGWTEEADKWILKLSVAAMIY